MVRITFSLDAATVRTIKRTAGRLGRPQSQIVREAIAEFAASTERTTDAERLRLLEVVDRLRAEKPTRTAKAVDAELDALRRRRRAGGRRHAALWTLNASDFKDIPDLRLV